MNQREYKFRAWDAEQKAMRSHDWLSAANVVYGALFDMKKRDCITIMQFSGFKDRSGKEIYDGDRISIRSPYRTTQTHTGDNIPNGSYTEPMEPGIKTEEYEVVFQDGMFAGKNLDVKENLMPLAWLIEQQDEESIKNAIWCRSCGLWDDPEEGDLQYLLIEYKLKDLAALIEYVSGCEVTGHIYEDVEA